MNTMPGRIVARPLFGRTLRLVALSMCVLLQREAGAFGLENVALRARRLAESAYQEPQSNVPKNLKSLDYARYRDIRFRAERALWRDAGLAFEVQFFHEGRHYDLPVTINEVNSDGIREVRFSPAMFDYGPNGVDPRTLAKLGFAGFRIHFPLNAHNRKDEFLVFLGASYFRGVGSGQRYGLSARALAVDTALASGEEFPRFVEFWIARPAPGARTLTVYGLLDSRRVTGAYRFVIEPGENTAVEVTARLFFREHVGKLGLAPLTSMYFFGENQPAPAEDFRPEVHDSDGLSIEAASGDWIWRPLVNPRRLLVTSFSAVNPRGFGLQQRDRDFADYQDPDRRYELRPGAWVEPKGAWGAGRIELVALPVPDETNDNIVAYWMPDAQPRPRQPYEFAYRLSWQKERETRPPLAWVMQTRRGRDPQAGKERGLVFVVDFAAPTARKLAPRAPAGAALNVAAIPPARPESDVWLDANGKLLGSSLRRNDATGAWRLMLRVRRLDAGKPLELRATLRTRDTPLSETWSYVLPPE